MSCCPPSQHAAIQADPARWAACRLVGYQDSSGRYDGPGMPLVFELRACDIPGCTSTLSIEVPLTPAIQDAIHDQEWRQLALQQAARIYAAALTDGAEIMDHTDGPVIAAYAHLIPGELVRRGLVLDVVPGGYRVRAVSAGTRPRWTAAALADAESMRRPYHAPTLRRIGEHK